MWTAYSKEHWPEAINLKTAVRRLGCEFHDEATDRYFQQNRIHPEEDYVRFLEEQEKFERGSELCDNFTAEKITVDEFCRSLIEIGLKVYLNRLDCFLSDEIIKKYNI